MLPIGLPSHWVGRAQELSVLRTAVAALHGGVGSVVWVEGEPGIGKSSLVAEALAGADPQWDSGWAMADQLSGRLPLRVMLDCLGVRTGSPDPRRAHAAGLLRDRQRGLPVGGDMSATGVEVLVTLVDELCAAAPVVLVVDDLQWADEASLLVWHQLAASIGQLRLLLVGTCRPAPLQPEVQQARAAVARRGGAVIMLARLAETDVTDLVTAMIGAPPGDGLRRLTAQAAGNPLYVRELIDALVREQAVQAGPVAEVALAGDQLPLSLAGVLTGRLNSVSPETAQLLRAAALLGGGFTADDLSVVLRQPVSALAAALQEAVAAGILAEAGTELVFRHQLIRQALYESMPLTLRTALHAEAARELADADADALSVAQQLSAAGRLDGGWTRKWLIQAAPALAARAPRLAVELLQRELDAVPGGETRDSLVNSLLWAQLAAGSYEEAVRQASWALLVMTDAAQRAETYWMLAHAQVSAGRGDDAIITIGQALAPADLPGKWQARMLALLSMLERGASGFAVADATARQALAAAEEAGDRFATAHALTDLWLTDSIGRDHPTALEHIDRTLRVLGDDPEHADLRAVALDARTFTLQNLDQWPQAELALRQAREFALRTGRPDRATWVNAAVLRYWLGQWDDALAELGSDAADSPGLMYSFLRERWSALLIHGVTALIAGHRDQRSTAARQLQLGLALPIENVTDRENQDFLAAAHALALEQSGETGPAVTALAAALLPRRGDEMTLIHQWLPDLVRLALAAGDTETARDAAAACRAEAAAETRPARATYASLRCRGLLDSDPDPLRDAVAHYRTVGPAVELPAALEDLAVVLAERGQEEEARDALNEAVTLYEGLQARWDIRRADGRLRAYGIRRSSRSRRTPRAAFGWAALTPTEVKIAALVARGDSTPDIARSMFLSRRTVQTYISRILTKLDAKSRVEIVTVALRQGVSP